MRSKILCRLTAVSGVASAAAMALAISPTIHAGDIVEADGHRSVLPERPEKKPASKFPLATQVGADFIPAPMFTLGPINTTPLFLEDEQELLDGGPLRYGLTRDLEIFEADGQWIDIPGGRLWRIEIASDGAENTRLKIVNMGLPRGAELRMFSPMNPDMVAGPFTEDGPAGDGSAWSHTRPGDSVVVEYFEPSTMQNKGRLPFDITEVIHGYRPILKDGLAGGAGSCNLTPACYSAWGDIADATALVLFSGGFVCSGQLIATVANDETPYYITANHCISSQSAASSAEFVFRYERPTCTGSVSGGVSTSGSTLVDTWSASDNTLLRINGALPSGLFWVGWTTDSPAVGTSATCLHHPAGDYMRISFGNTNSDAVCGSNANWVGMGWGQGTTEGGSSGSGIYRDSDQRLFGVLTCGAASCSNQSGLDGYGRFAPAYNNGFSQYLGNSSGDDGYEDNDTCGQAASLGNGSFSNLIVRSTDEDWFSMSVPAGNTLEISLDFVNTNGDIDANLYSSCGGSVIASGTSNNDDESLSWTNDGGSDTTVYLHVFMFSDTENFYGMTVNNGDSSCPAGFTADCVGTCFPDAVFADWNGDGYCDDGAYIPSEYGYEGSPEGVAIFLNCDGFSCDSGDCTGCDGGGGGGGGGGGTCDDATVIGLGDTPFSTTGSSASLDLTGACDLGEFGDEVIYNVIYFEFTPDESGTVTVSTCNQADFDTRLSAHAGDCEPSSVITCLDDSEGCAGFTTEISFSATGGSTYILAVGGYSAADQGSGTLTVSNDDGGGGGGGGGECPAGFTADCAGTCFPDGVYTDWSGDTYCDNGAYIPADYCDYPSYDCAECPAGVAIFLNCDEFDCDGGDCTDCDGGGGGGGGGKCDPTVVVVGDNAVDTTGFAGVTHDLTGFCDPGEFGTDAFQNTGFYSFTAPASGLYTVSTCNQTAWDTRLSIHTETCDPSSVIVCLDDTEECENFTTTIEFTAVEGNLYVIALGGYGTGDLGPSTLTIDGDTGGTNTGACCLDGVCSTLTSVECGLVEGTYLGNGTSCGAQTCSGPVGACCLDGVCSQLDETNCGLAGGTFEGAGTSCTPNPCSGNGCPGDLNGDAVVDGSDLTIMLGAWGLIGGDLNGSGTTDGADLTILLGYWGDC